MKILESTHLCYHEVITNCCRNSKRSRDGVMAYVYCISKLVGNISYGTGCGVIEAGFSLTFEVEGHCLVSRQVPCISEGRRPEPLGGSGGMLPRKIFRT